MMSSKGVLKNNHIAQTGVEIFSRYLSINQSTSKIVLRNLAKITSACEKLCLIGPRSSDIPGSAQFYNLMAYCNRWGSQGS